MARKELERNTIIIGGGFYGLRVALYLAEELNQKNILIIEKEAKPMERASYVNQARIHNGYHYPRSVLTAHRSTVNFPEFIKEYGPAVRNDFVKHYAVAKRLSKINARQFVAFAHKIGATIKNASDSVASLFDSRLTESVFEVEEYAFDSHELRELLIERIEKSKAITILTNQEVDFLKDEAQGISVHLVDKSKVLYSRRVINCTYSMINKLHRNSGLELVALKHELTEMCLVKLPEKLKDFSVTVMDGPFFSIMPFPTTPYHTLSHVRYTPHMSWLDDSALEANMQHPHQFFTSIEKRSRFAQMKADVVRFIPSLKDMTQADSIWEVKTVLLKSEENDSRPILMRSDFGLEGYTCIMGAKIDNIYDVFEELRGIYETAKP